MRVCVSTDVTVASQADIEPCGDPRICLVGSLADDAEAVEATKVSRIIIRMVFCLYIFVDKIASYCIS